MLLARVFHWPSGTTSVMANVGFETLFQGSISRKSLKT
jgi:hypothetical protein